ncbi:YlxM family DNA-binding protein [Gudongella oleilytica]|uniref:YlxM family DNA-binding protein n=1 Tax=Gudongella oleilytica TaxID=1582259 RepID=UPI000FF8785D|nr:sigma factor-like helix-turn-helix DNA-binding protein [Gudongella oleilytica]
MDKLVKIGILLDFYGKLLSEKQYQIMELYYLNDFSLSEIGEELRISRQSVFDTIKRSEEKLYSFENELGLVDKFYSSQDTIRDIRKIAAEIYEIGENGANKEIMDKAIGIEERISKILI